MDLYFGLDDSNHAGQKKGEIIVATYSFWQEDSIVRDWPNTRNHSDSLKWLSTEGRGRVFTVLLHEENRHIDYNLPLVAPYLINHVLERTYGGPDNIKIFLDGHLRTSDRKILREDFSEIFPNVVVDNFTKKERGRGMVKRKRPHCPAVVNIADNLSNYLFCNRSLEELTNSRGMVPIDREEIVERIKLFKRVRE